MAEEYYNSCWDNYGGGSTGSTTASTQSCDRASQPTKKDYIAQVKFVNMEELRKAEGWFAGAPEVYFIAHTNAADPRYKQIKKIILKVDRSRWKDCGLFKCKPEWYFVDLPVVRWDRMDFSDRMVYYWYESDGETGTKTTEVTNTFTDPITGITTMVKTTTVTQLGDYALLFDHVEYCDKSSSGSEIYTTGSIEFALKIK